MAATITITKLQNGSIKIVDSNKDTCRTRPQEHSVSKQVGPNSVSIHQSLTEIEKWSASEVLEVVRQDGTIVPILGNLTTLFNELSTYFFFDNSSSSGGNIGPNAGSLLVFCESFTGNGSDTTFQLNGTVQNATFSSGLWSTSNIQTTLISNIVRNDNLKPTYDLIPNFLGNRINVSSISPTGLVTTDFIVRSGLSVNVYYWYYVQAGDEIIDYHRDDIVSKSEADNSRIDAKIDSNEEIKSLDADLFPTFDTGVVLSDLALVIADLEAITPVIAHANAFVTETLTPGVYQTPGAGSIAGTLTLDGSGSPVADRIFVIRATGAFPVTAAATIVLIDVLPENVHFIADGAMPLGAGVTFNGNIICKAGAPSLGVGCTVVGRMLTLAGAVSSDSSSLIKPTGVGLDVDYRACFDMVMFTGTTPATSAGGASSYYEGGIASHTGTVGGFGSALGVFTIYPAGISTPKQNNYLPFETGGAVTFADAGIVYISPSGDVIISGFDSIGFSTNHKFILVNVGSANATLTSLDNSSLEANKIAADTDIVLKPYQSKEIIRRNVGLNKWLVNGNN